VGGAPPRCLGHLLAEEVLGVGIIGVDRRCYLVISEQDKTALDQKSAEIRDAAPCAPPTPLDLKPAPRITCRPPALFSRSNWGEAA
jgi:hypothetical protein